MSEVHILDHPLILHKLSMMREKNTNTKSFRELLTEISMLMGYEVTRNFPTKNIRIETPIREMDAPFLATEDIVIIPILRAGLGMTDGLLQLMPTAKVGHIGLYRAAGLLLYRTVGHIDAHRLCCRHRGFRRLLHNGFRAAAGGQQEHHQDQ